LILPGKKKNLIYINKLFSPGGVQTTLSILSTLSGVAKWAKNATFQQNQPCPNPVLTGSILSWKAQGAGHKFSSPSPVRVTQPIPNPASPRL